MIGVFHGGRLEGKGFQIGADQLYNISGIKFVSEGKNCVSVCIAAVDKCDNLPFSNIAGIFIILPRRAIIKTGRLMTMADALHFVPPDGV